MAGGARAGTAARSLHVEVFGLGDVEEVGPRADGDGVGGGVFEEEGYRERFFSGGRGVDVPMGGGGSGGESSSGSGKCSMRGSREAIWSFRWGFGGVSCEIGQQAVGDAFKDWEDTCTRTMLGRSEE